MFDDLEVLALIDDETIEKSVYCKVNGYYRSFKEMKEKGLIDFQEKPVFGSPEPIPYNFSLTEYGKQVLEQSRNQKGSVWDSF